MWSFTQCLVRDIICRETEPVHFYEDMVVGQGVWRGREYQTRLMRVFSRARPSYTECYVVHFQ